LRLKDLGLLVTTVSTAMLVYGVLTESKRLVVERHTLYLKGWPKRLNGFRIAVVGDLHLRDSYSVELAQRAIALTLDEEPDMVALVGDFVAYWKPSCARMLGETLEPLMLMNGNVVAVPGNHDYFAGNPSLLAPILEELNIKLLRNGAWRHAGVTWVGIDSYNKRRSKPVEAMAQADDDPVVVLWHEPDPVDQLPPGAALQLSGHSHGGQFRFPGGIIPMKSRNGEKYVDGFYPDASTPVFVTRGVGTTGPPSRFLCPPDVSILTLNAAISGRTSEE
jgi:hypothetical protein